jgi:alpha-glucoside transport system permease protein
MVRTWSRFRSQWLLPLLFALVCILWCLPLLGVIVTSVRPASGTATTGWWMIIADGLATLENYAAALQAPNMTSGLLNSVLITLPATILAVAIAACAAYALAWTDIPGRLRIYGLVVALMCVPGEITLIPSLIIFRTVGLVNTYPSIWISHATAALPFGVFLLWNFFARIPSEIVDAARVDGAGPVRIFWNMILPLSPSALAALAIFEFLWIWNDLLRALVILPNPAIRPLTAAVANLGGDHGENIALIAAGAVILMVPPIVVFLLGQKAFVRGVLAGAVK